MNMRKSTPGLREYRLANRCLQSTKNFVIRSMESQSSSCPRRQKTRSCLPSQGAGEHFTLWHSPSDIVSGIASMGIGYDKPSSLSQARHDCLQRSIEHAKPPFNQLHLHCRFNEVLRSIITLRGRCQTCRLDAKHHSPHGRRKRLLGCWDQDRQVL